MQVTNSPSSNLATASPARAEAHLFIIWEKAYAKRADILQDLKRRFRIAEVCEISWTSEYFAENLTRFYGTKLPDRSFKERHCGRGPFTAVVVFDETPRWAARNTSKGRFDVNADIFDAKAKYRRWTGGGHRIHATNTPAETAHDLMLLLGTSPDRYEQSHWAGHPRTLSRDLVGSVGWRCLDELFEVLGACAPYVVLRNFDGLPAEMPHPEHPDIDFLTEDREEFAFLLNGRKLHRDPDRCAFEVLVGGKQIPCDVRSVGDGYYDERWQSGMLKRREFRQGIFVPGREDHASSLLYHALVHKPLFTADARESVAGLGTPLDLPALDVTSRAAAMQWLCGFMSHRHYDFTMPRDYSVGFNLEGVPRIRCQTRSRLQRELRSLAQEVRLELTRRSTTS